MGAWPLTLWMEDTRVLGEWPWTLKTLNIQPDSTAALPKLVGGCLPGSGPTTSRLGARAGNWAVDDFQALGRDSKLFQRAVLRTF